jgi:hypothetical protein
MDAFEDDGVFWLPDKKMNTVAGHLKFDPAEGTTLSLIGNLEDLAVHFQRSRGTTRLHGVAGRRYVTLDACFAVRTGYSMPGIAQQAYSVGLVITGYLFDDDEQLTFDRFSVEFDRLSSWVRRSGIAVQLRAPDATQIIDHVEITFDQPSDETVSLGGDELTLSSSWRLHGDKITETSLLQSTQLEIKYLDARPLADILGDIRWLQDLVTLTTTAPTVPTSITLWREDILRERPPGALGKPKPQPMDYYAGQIAERVRLKEPQDPQRIMFRYEAIGGLATIARWIAVARRYEIVVSSLLSIRYSAGLYAQNRFSNVISAAESFHRLRFSNAAMPESKFDQRLEEIISQVAKRSRQDWLRMKLRYANEPSLANRLTAMTGHAGSAFTTLCADPVSWVTVVTESRNRLTHHDKERKIEFARGDLHFLAESIFMLVMLCLFRECEVASETLDTIGETNVIQFLRSSLNEIVPRLYGEIENIKKRERAEWKRPRAAANTERTPTGSPNGSQETE